MGAEDEEDRGAGQDGQLGPDGQEPLRLAQQPARAGVRARARGCRRSGRWPGRRGRLRGPGSTARPRACRRGRGGGRDRPGGAALAPRRTDAFSSRETCRGRWTKARSGRPRRKSQCRPAMWAPRWLPTRIAPRPGDQRAAQMLVARGRRSGPRPPSSDADVERVVAGQEARRVGRQRRPLSASIGPSSSERRARACRQGAHQPGFPPPARCMTPGPAQAQRAASARAGPRALQRGQKSS